MSRSVEQPPSPLPITSFFERTEPKTWGRLQWIVLVLLDEPFVLLTPIKGSSHMRVKFELKSYMECRWDKHLKTKCSWKYIIPEGWSNEKCKILHNELYDLYESPSSVRTLRWGKLRWAVQVARRGRQGIFRKFVNFSTWKTEKEWGCEMGGREGPCAMANFVIIEYWLGFYYCSLRCG